MACGTPVLMSSEPALSETYGEYGHFFKIADLKEMREQLESLLTDPVKLKQYTVKAESFAQKMTWKACAVKTLETYKQAVKEFKED